MSVARTVEKSTEIPDGVKVSIAGDKIIVSGESERLTMDFRHPRIKVIADENRVVVRSSYPSKSDIALMGTIMSHIENMIIGVTEGFEYRMKIVYSHFPIKVSYREEDKQFIIENFLGERSPRRAKIVGKTRVDVRGDEVILTGPNIQDVGQSAANIERATIIKNYDPRVFQDGIYITQKKKGA